MLFCNSLSNLLCGNQYHLHAGEASPHPALAGTFQKSSSKGSSKLEQYKNICFLSFTLPTANVYTLLGQKESVK